MFQDYLNSETGIHNRPSAGDARAVVGSRRVRRNVVIFRREVLVPIRSADFLKTGDGRLLRVILMEAFSFA
jgi:hypothetical protein